MAKGYSIRRAINYNLGKDGKWKLHSIASHINGYTRLFPTIEDARKFALEKMNNGERNENEVGYIQYCKIYCGNQYIETVTR